MFRRFLFQLSLDGNQALRSWLLEDPEPFNRLLLLGHSENAPTPSEHLHLLLDKSVFVRLRYFHWRLRQKIQPAEDELIVLATDKNRSLRDIGRFYLQKIYGIDAYELYKHRTGDDFYFIADYRRTEDVNHFIKGLHSQSKKVREMCLSALAATDPNRLKDLNLASLIQGNRHTRAIVCHCMPRIFSVAELGLFRDAFESSSPDGPVTYLAVLEKMSFWAFLDSALDYLISGASPAMVAFIRNTVNKKTQIFERLPQETRDRIDEKLNCLKQRPANYPINDLELLEFIARRA